MVAPIETAARSRLFRRIAPWLSLLLVLGIAFGILPSAFAAPGDTSDQAIQIGSDGNFYGTLAPQKSMWFHWWYMGSNQQVTIAITYQPPDSNHLDFFVNTGTPPNNLHQESTSAGRNGNVLSMTWSDPNARDVYLQVVNNHTDRTVTFVGTINPPGAIGTLAPGTVTPTIGAGNDATTAFTVGADGNIPQGIVGAHRATWYRFWYGNAGADAVISATFSPSADNADIKLYSGQDPTNLTLLSGGTTRSGDTLSRSVNNSSTQWVYFAISNNNDTKALIYTGTVKPSFPPPVTPTPTVSPTATPAPTATPQAAPAVAHDERYFPQTQYRVDNDTVWNFFQTRGQVTTFGYPVSRTFTFLGCPVQMFQRLIIQVCPGQGPGLINFLDPEIFPYTHFNGSTVPGPDQNMKNNTPAVGSPNYSTAILDFVRSNAPDTFEGDAVNFGQTFFATGGLEIWGPPISAPMRDPNNNNFVYQRFQRGIMHFDKTNGLTQGLLLVDYFKAIILNRNIPGDMASQVQSSRFFAEYCPGPTGWLCRPGDMPGSDLTFAFETG